MTTNAATGGQDVSDHRQWYAVVHIDTGGLRYLGRCESTAAMCWNPGTTYAKGPTRVAAVVAAEKSAEQFRIVPFQDAGGTEPAATEPE